jgi:hypothetical protein
MSFAIVLTSPKSKHQNRQRDIVRRVAHLVATPICCSPRTSTTTVPPWILSAHAGLIAQRHTWAVARRAPIATEDERNYGPTLEHAGLQLIAQRHTWAVARRAPTATEDERNYGPTLDPLGARRTDRTASYLGGRSTCTHDRGRVHALTLEHATSSRRTQNLSVVRPRPPVARCVYLMYTYRHEV